MAATRSTRSAKGSKRAAAGSRRNAKRRPAAASSRVRKSASATPRRAAKKRATAAGARKPATARKTVAARKSAAARKAPAAGKTATGRKSTTARKTAASTRPKTASAARRAPARSKAATAKPAAASGRTRRAATSSARQVPARPVRVHRTATVAKTAKRPAGAMVLVPVSAAGPRWTEKLRDGTHVMIRPLRKTDADIERAFIEHLSPEAKRFRFLGMIGTPSDEFVRSLIDIDYLHDVAFVALVHDAGEKKEVGVSRFSLSADGSAAECAVVVADEWQGRGLGVLLMRHLIGVARERGIHRLVSVDAAENARMRELARFLGFTTRLDPQDPHQVIYSLDL